MYRTGGGVNWGILGAAGTVLLLLSFHVFRYLCGIFLLNYYFTFGSVATLFKNLLSAIFVVYFLKRVKEKERERNGCKQARTGRGAEIETAHTWAHLGMENLCNIFNIYMATTLAHKSSAGDGSEATHTAHTHTHNKNAYNTTKKRSMREKNSCK